MYTHHTRVLLEKILSSDFWFLGKHGFLQWTSDNEDGGARNVLCTWPRPAQSRSLEEEIESQICLLLQTLMIRVGPKLRKSKTPKSVFTPRRSERLAQKPRSANATLQAQSILLQKLGVADNTNTDDVETEAYEKFRAIFCGPFVGLQAGGTTGAVLG